MQNATTGGASIYDYPKYYDLVYGSDWKAEVDFLEYCIDAFVPHKVKRLFEPACGTGRLMFRMSKQGYRVQGLDLNEKAVDFCNQRLERHGFADRAFVGDMCDFELKKKFDVGFNTINSFRHLLSEAEAASHLQCMADNMNVGGIYVLGLHLLPLGQHECEGEYWTAQRGMLAINTRMWQIELDIKKRIETFRLEFDVYTPTDIQKIGDDVAFRTYTKPQILSLVRRSPFEIAGVYDFAYDFENPAELNDKTEDVVLILQKSAN